MLPVQAAEEDYMFGYAPKKMLYVHRNERRFPAPQKILWGFPCVGEHSDVCRLSSFATWLILKAREQ